jgi:hypothetical protein
MDRFAHLLKGVAAANIGNDLINVTVSRSRCLLEQRRHSHDHPALAISALRDVILDPGLLDAVLDAIYRQPLDYQNLLSDRITDLHAAGSDRDFIDMVSAGAALRNTAAKFRCSEADILAECPQNKRGVSSSTSTTNAFPLTKRVAIIVLPRWARCRILVSQKAGISLLNN